MLRRNYDHEILLLQGGGALGAYQAGVYEGLAEAGMVPDWVVGISIGAINSAIIAGNPPERRVERLRTFWDRVSAHYTFQPPAWMDVMRPLLTRMSVASIFNWGVPIFFSPRPISPLMAGAGSLEALSFYDTAPLKTTLEELVDFDLINRRTVRLSLGAVNVRTGESVYFDNHKTKIGPEQVMASGALPPGFPAVQIDGHYYWDGGCVSNSPLTYVVDEKPLRTVLFVQVNLWNARGDLPRNLDEVMERLKDIQYSSKQRVSNQRVRELTELRFALARLLDKLPANLKADPDVAKLSTLCDNRDWTLAHINNHRRAHAGNTKDADFSRATVNDNWIAGVEDIRHSMAHANWVQPTELGQGMRIYYLPPSSSLDLGKTVSPAVEAEDVAEEVVAVSRTEPRSRRTA
jgi:NTE family protein